MSLKILSSSKKTIACFFFALFYTNLLYTVKAWAEMYTPFSYTSNRGSFDKKLINRAVSFSDQGKAKDKIADFFKPFYKDRIQNSNSGFKNEQYKRDFGGGPTQPEMQAFHSVNANNMVDLFSGDFSYNIPLLDVGGYPVNLSYRSGISMDQESSWVGLGWNVNPGSITRNLRGLPDDFNGNDSVKKVTGIKQNKTIGGTLSGDMELDGLPLNVSASLGVFNNNYKGWGLETGVNATINSGVGTKGILSGGLSLTNNSQEGLTLAPSLSIKLTQDEIEDNAGVSGSISISAPYNTRSGLKCLQLSAGVRQYYTDDADQKQSMGASVNPVISFVNPSFTPTITMPLTTNQYSFTAKVGFEYNTYHPNLYLNGYVSKQYIASSDTLLALPSYGYMHYEDAADNPSGLLDFNREKEIAYRDNPAVPNIAVPIYTYDAFSITGEGTGGMFRAYRGDIGFVYDHQIRTKDGSGKASLDLGVPDLVHAGIDLNVNRAYTQNGPWLDQNVMRTVTGFQKSSGTFEASYFRNPGEKSINSSSFYNAIGGDDLVTVALFQPGASSSLMQATNYLNMYRNKQYVSQTLLTTANTVKTSRDKRTQVISYLTAQEATSVGLSKYIENYTVNNFGLRNCNSNAAIASPPLGTGLVAQYYPKLNFQSNTLDSVINESQDIIDHSWGDTYSSYPNINSVVNSTDFPSYGFPKHDFSVRYQGQILAPVTGSYYFTTVSDDGVLLWMNDSLVISRNNQHSYTKDSVKLNLVAGQFYNIRLDYYNAGGPGVIQLFWSYTGQFTQVIPISYQYPPAVDSTIIDSNLVYETRINSYRKANHISEIDVLNNDGRRYVYGIPVYNLLQKEATFAVNGSQRGNLQTGLVGYNNGIDNTVAGNQNGNDNYVSYEQMPAYAHSFLLTGILSPDYVDITGNGITDDDQGDAVKFNYSKVCGIGNPYKWRTPYITDSVSYNPGLRSDSRDDKGNYVYGEKELWYLHSIESKTMVANFVLQNRNDLYAIDEGGNKYADSSGKCLKEIDLYNKADYLNNPTTATPIKVVHFEYDYELCNGVNLPLTDSGKLTLKRIWFTYNGNNKGKLNPYVFYYHPNNPSYNTKSYDRWGNFKDPLQNPGSTAANYISNSDYPYAIQDSTLAGYNAGAWSLDSVFLPSGGSLKVDYESDDYAYVQNLRAMQMFKLLGLSADSVYSHAAPNLYKPAGGSDNLYVFVSVPTTVSSKLDVFQKYLTGVQKLYFKLFVKMPDDQYGTGSEYISTYANLDSLTGYGRVSNNVIWIKMSGISLPGTGPGSYSPLAKAAIQFLRLNLGSKAYPGSEVGDNLDLSTAVKMIGNLTDNIVSAFSSFDNIARGNNWAYLIDTSRTLVRLDNPIYKKYGGGHRVKRVTVYDNWNHMTGQRTASYGQEYIYTTQQDINGVMTTISSGVASYEPGIGNEENPFHLPLEYVESIAPLGPVTLGYSEEPLGEALFPSANIGYSQVTSRTINYKNNKSANGYEVSKFYTAYDFPTLTDHTVIDNETQKRYKPGLAYFLRVNAKYFLTVSQGFKVELNDMHGKMRSQGYYPQTDPNNPVTYTENFYDVVNQNVDQKMLANTVMVMHPDGTIDTAATIGKDAELMMDMREQESVTSGNDYSVNLDAFEVPFFPFLMVLPSFIAMPQREENRFHSVATMKVIQRYGILDSVMHIDKGSRVSTKDLMYDSETGDVLLTRTQNEFNDPVYTFNYPTHWAYDGMGLAYQNIDIVLSHVYLRNGKITSGLSAPDSTIFSSGDEILVQGKQKTGDSTVACHEFFATFAAASKIWAVDTSLIKGGAKGFYFIDINGKPYTGFDVSLKIVRSGRRNVNSSVGSVSCLANPLTQDSVSHLYSLALSTGTKILNAASSEYTQTWKVSDLQQPRIFYDTTYTTHGCADTIAANFQDSSVSYCFSAVTNDAYSADGAIIHKSTHSNDSSGGDAISVNEGFWEGTGSGLNNGRLNETGVWICNSNSAPMGKWVGFSQTVYIPAADTIFIGVGGDNQVKVVIDNIDSVQALEDYSEDPTPFYSWHIFPVHLSPGYHSFAFEGYNYEDVATFGAEIYNLTRQQLLTVDSNTVKSNTLFSTRQITSYSQTYNPGYSCPIGFNLDSGGGHYRCITQIPCTSYTVTSVSSCHSMVTDTTLNPYIAGALGNWRDYKNYAYYTRRAETDPTTTTNIRTNGTFSFFAPFWAFQSSVLKTQYDTTKWVWNSQITLVNQKGMEIENMDPLGRYNSGLYGYNYSLPTAVIQNGHYRESAFEGYEDYGYTTQFCDTQCTTARHFDYSAFSSKITSTQSHTGQYSIQLNGHDSVALGYAVVTTAQDSLTGKLYANTYTDSCSGLRALKNITADDSLLIPNFSPFKTKQMLVSAWVKEGQACTCVSYTHNQIIVSYTGSITGPVTFTPAGNIIEGWQRYEGYFTIPSDASGITIKLKSTDTTIVYFDDIRVHPFNANMKSFVYNPVNLRLMAELDENNYATFYEYDDDGTLIRVKKETERGIMTIKETRSALLKQ
jgi:hypothetical protein